MVFSSSACAVRRSAQCCVLTCLSNSTCMTHSENVQQSQIPQVMQHLVCVYAAIYNLLLDQVDQYFFFLENYLDHFMLQPLMARRLENVSKV